MTFVAQPYEQFVDDLLTSLTGGVIREEHLFRGPDESYSLGAADAVDFSIRVFGQRNETYVLFDAQNDYSFDSANAAIRWRKKARLPDEQSYFYVNYYRREVTPSLTDRNPGSVVTLLSQAVAREWAVLHKQMEEIYRSAFVELAAGPALDHVVALMGIERRDAKFASGEVVFKRTSPATGDITVPAGTVVSTEQAISFSTTERRTLRKGQLSVSAPIRAEMAGTDGKVDALNINVLNRPIFGIDSVSNIAATVFASEKETDEELRRRMQATLERAGGATVEAIRYKLIEDVPEVNEGNFQITENAQSPGVVDLRFGLESGSPDLVRRVEDAIFAARPAGVRITHNLPTGKLSAGGTDISRKEAQADFIRSKLAPAEPLGPDVLAEMPNGMMPLRIEVFLRLAQANLSAAQKETIEDGARQAILAYVSSLPMGEAVVYNRLLANVMNVEGIDDADLLVGAEFQGKFQGRRGNIGTDNRKALIDAQHIFVGLMDEIVELTLAIAVEAKAGTTPSPTALLASISTDSPAMHAVTDAVAAVLGSTNSVLKRAVLLDSIRAALAQQAVPLQIAASNGLTMSCRYVESGRLLKNTEEVPLGENEVLHLQTLSMKLAGALDV
ncbi:baseplate J/gp47 family protein [Caballeronia sp. LZ029]|uniref:baseplate J/gp47 family protein n=1 Tax=Caballeronia sp. LZ029 TaxID=3038564 RepID=UPI00285E7F9C|nr:baseplate J/gp47 family protein [Caballeronia sp. LZ029]MDR5748846.1 baseplate J/gp47 family protein [Caballeronia sp. LZ029]